VIGCTVEFADLPYGDVGLTYEQKKRLVKTIREIRPEVVLMQDPEHVWHDLDPDRRMGMMVTLEALALAGRDFAQEDLPGLEPFRVPTIYYLWPENPNCVLDISPVWSIKEKAAECIKYQHEFSTKILEQMFTKESLGVVVPGYHSMETDLEKGYALHREMDKASAVYYGLCSHGHFALAEAYRREGQFQLHELIP
jgi:LmbE family N-acetylglucosaminyl deacetylase